MTRRLSVVLTMCLLSSALVPAQTPVPESARTATPSAGGSEEWIVPTTADFRIGPEDVLDILVWKNDELSRTVPVRPDGKVSLPLVNDVLAAGLTPAGLRDQLTRQFAEFVPSPEVSVIVREVHSFKVAVIGAVRMPGQYEIKGPASVLDVIARAQGFNEFAARDRIVVLRRSGTGTTRLPLNYGKVAEGQQEIFDVRPGDLILVP
jgi:polysaccharide export outer membrane protein